MHCRKIQFSIASTVSFSRGTVMCKCRYQLMHLHCWWKATFAPQSLPLHSDRKSPAFSADYCNIPGKFFCFTVTVRAADFFLNTTADIELYVPQIHLLIESYMVIRICSPAVSGKSDHTPRRLSGTPASGSASQSTNTQYISGMFTLYIFTDSDVESRNVR